LFVASSVEKVDFQLRMDAFDVFNHRQFTPGNATAFSVGGAGSTYATLTNPQFLNSNAIFEGGSRTMQIVAKFRF